MKTIRTIDKQAADAAIALVLENSQKADTDKTKLSRAALKRHPNLVRRVNVIGGRLATVHLVDDAVDSELAQTAMLRQRRDEADDLAAKYALQRQIDDYRVRVVQKAQPGAGNRLKELPEASRRLRRKMEHDARRGMSADLLIDAHGRLARHVLSDDAFNAALALRHRRGQSKGIQPVVAAALVADEVKEAA